MKIIEAFELSNNKLNPIKLGKFYSGKDEHPLINVYDIENAEILGFGGAFSETSAYNYSFLSEENKK